MSIYIKNNSGEHTLAPYNYEKTLLSLGGLVCWIEGTKNVQLSFNPQRFGIAGGPIWTNYGVYFTKQHLEEIISKMNDGSELRIAYPDQYVNTNRNRCKNEDTIEESFAKDNDKIQISPNSFAPSKYVKELLKLNSKDIHPDYIEHCKFILGQNKKK